MTTVLVSRKYIILFLIFILVSACHPIYGIIESELKLGNGSPIPTWINLPEDNTRNDIDVSFTYYSHPIFNKVKVVAKLKKDGTVIFQKVGSYKAHKLTKNYATFPNYTIIEIEGVSEVFEQKEPNNLLYVFREGEKL
jgi:hypothetical protein